MTLLFWALAALVAPSAPATATECPLRLVAGSPGENHVLFNGVSPDSRTLAVGWDSTTGSETKRGAYLLDLRSGQRTALPQLNNAPSFSPNGRFLVSANYASDRALRTEIVELDRRTGQTRTFASAPSGEWLASYSPDSKWILFNSTRSGRSDLYRVRRSDGALEQLTADARYEAHGTFTAGGRSILFHRQIDGDNYDVITRDLLTGGERAIGATKAEEAYPALSPDGRWVVFSSPHLPGAQPSLVVMTADGSHKRRLTAGKYKDAYATWAKDGRAIYFVRFAEDGSKIYRLALRNGACAR